MKYKSEARIFKRIKNWFDTISKIKMSGAGLQMGDIELKVGNYSFLIEHKERTDKKSIPIQYIEKIKMQANARGKIPLLIFTVYDSNMMKYKDYIAMPFDNFFDVLYNIDKEIKDKENDDTGKNQ